MPKGAVPPSAADLHRANDREQGKQTVVRWRLSPRLANSRPFVIAASDGPVERACFLTTGTRRLPLPKLKQSSDSTHPVSPPSAFMRRLPNRSNSQLAVEDSRRLDRSAGAAYHTIRGTASENAWPNMVRTLSIRKYDNGGGRPPGLCLASRS